MPLPESPARVARPAPSAAPPSLCSGLKPQTTYFYRCGDAETGYSDEASFVTAPVGAVYPFVLGTFGDVGAFAGTRVVSASVPLTSVLVRCAAGRIQRARTCERRKAGCHAQRHLGARWTYL